MRVAQRLLSAHCCYLLVSSSRNLLGRIIIFAICHLVWACHNPQIHSSLSGCKKDNLSTLLKRLSETRSWTLLMILVATAIFHPQVLTSWGTWAQKNGFVSGNCSGSPKKAAAAAVCSSRCFFFSSSCTRESGDEGNAICAIHSYIHHCQEESQGVKNHLNFTSKNCKVKIHDLLCWAMILHGFATTLRQWCTLRCWPFLCLMNCPSELTDFRVLQKLSRNVLDNLYEKNFANLENVPSVRAWRQSFFFFAGRPNSIFPSLYEC